MLFAGPPAPLWHASDHQSMLSCHIMIHCEPRNILENVNGIFSLGFITVHIFIYTLMIFYWSSWEPKLWQWQETNPAASAGICIQPAVLLLISDRRFANICFHSWTKIKKNDHFCALFGDWLLQSEVRGKVNKILWHLFIWVFSDY